MPEGHDAFAAALGEAGRTLVRLGRYEEAVAAFQQLVVVSPQNADAHNGQGAAFRGLRKFEPALASFGAALRLDPNHVGATNNYGLTLHDLGRSSEAATYLSRAVSLRPDHRPALSNLGMVLHSIDRHEEAVRYYARLVALEPRFDYAAGGLARSRLACCDWSSREEDTRRIVELMAAGGHPADALTSLMVSESPALHLDCARRFVARQYPPSNTPCWRGERYNHQRIRVAYLSADFHDHPVSHLLAGVLEHHDRQRFETIGVSLRRDPRHGAMHQRMKNAFEHFMDGTDIDDHEVALQLRKREVDIAVDLTGFTRGGRLGILACRPAPVQVNYLGFAASYGADYIDYVLADQVIIPGGPDTGHRGPDTTSGGDPRVGYSERIVRLPHSFMPSDDQQAVALEGVRRADLGLPAEGFVFCAFSNAYKITPDFFSVWMQLLREIPASVLWLREGPPATVANLRSAASSRGISPDRLVFAPRLPAMDQHLGRYRAADLFLDTAPYGAHATARDALWAGLPVLTRAGGSFASRVAASLLTALELPELVTSSLDEYGQLALALARSPERLSELRKRLIAHRESGPLFKTDLFRQHLESAYQCMWERSQRGEPPADINIGARG
jgi:predicted O-linked N-acetylglucosamine transferase (SPINDLY family)